MAWTPSTHVGGDSKTPSRRCGINCLSPPVSSADEKENPPQPEAASGRSEPHPFINRTPQSAELQADKTSSSLHQQYLDSLQPPTHEEFTRLSRKQEKREKEHKQRDIELRRKNKFLTQKSMEARRDFMRTKVLEKESQATQTHEQSKTNPNPPSLELQPQVHKNDDRDADGDTGPDSLKTKAATVIQRNYRGYRVRREMQGLGLDASTRWTHAIRDAQWKELTKPRARELNMSTGAGAESDRPSTSKSYARQKWTKAAMIARRAGGDEDSDHSVTTASSAPDSDEWAEMSLTERDAVRKKRERALAKRQKHARTMGLRYFLEMVDLKHRYGSHLRTYHEQWKQSDTKENFFYWLDYGEGKNLDLETCPRERLDRERVRYLNREERLHYLVQVDREGRLVWAKNGMRIDTTEEWKDSILGIVPKEDPTPAFSPEVENHVQDQAHKTPHQHQHHQHHHHHPQDRNGSRSSSSSSSSSPSHGSELEAAMAAKYANPDLDNAKGAKKIRHVSAATIFNKLLRKSVKKNTWIFVADTSFRLYVGIKASGAFQHSSFLHGSRISAAGLIKVKNGRLSSLSPLSGHYRPPASNFRAFVHSLEDEGVDMSHVSISRSYAVLVGLEMYIKTKAKGKELLDMLSLKKKKVLRPDEAKRVEEEACDNSQSAAKERKFLERQQQAEERRREENKASVKNMQKLGITPEVLPGHRDTDTAPVAGGENRVNR